jgi:uncharacterized SAM-binding protein YcdF (DUF218 family)
MYALVAQLLEPYTLLLLALLVSFIVAHRVSVTRGRAFWVSLAILVTLVVVSMPLFGYISLGSLEWRYKPNTVVPSREDVIVVLSGNFVQEDETCQKNRLGSETLERCLEAVHWYKQADGCRLLVSGGNIVPQSDCPALAEVMREFLLQQGVAAEDITMEDRSTTTAENAKFCAPLLAENRKAKVFLVTTAFHMPRSVDCFAKNGVTVLPIPCRRQAAHHEYGIRSFVPAVRGISQTCQAAHEWTGYVWYWLSGRL